MNKKGLAFLMRTRFATRVGDRLPRLPEHGDQMGGVAAQGLELCDDGDTIRGNGELNNADEMTRFGAVREWMHSALTMNKTEIIDTVLNNFSQNYMRLSHESQEELLLILSKGYDLKRTQVANLMKQYMGIQLPDGELDAVDEEAMLSAVYRIERNLRQSLKPAYDVLFERLNTHPGGLKFLSVLRADILSLLEKKNVCSLRAMDNYLKEKLSTWLSPASLELHHITWDCPSSLLEKIVAYEAVHPISSLIDLKRRLGVGRRCFGYFHPAIPAEPLIFIEIAMLKNMAQTIQEVLWDDPPIPESESQCALFYSISSTQPGLSGINLGKFLIKRVITLLRRDMPHIFIFATLSPIPGFLKWLQSKLASQLMLSERDQETPVCGGCATFQEDLLEAEEEKKLMSCCKETTSAKNGMEVLLTLLSSSNIEWIQSDEVVSAVKAPLMRLCARYLLLEKKRGKAMDSVANFHLQNGAMIEKINWMADRSVKGLRQSGGIMVNYEYRVDNIEEYAQMYYSTGRIHTSSSILCYIQEGPSEIIVVHS